MPYAACVLVTRWRSALDRTAPFKGATEGDLVGILEVAADGQSAREA
jgi:hypothetical protein